MLVIFKLILQLDGAGTARGLAAAREVKMPTVTDVHETTKRDSYRCL